MRDWINIVTEGEVVSMGQHKFNKAAGEYTSALQDIIAQMAARYSDGKFIPIATTYIESGFNPEYKPIFYVDVDVSVEKAKRGSLAVAFLRGLRGFKYHKGDKWTGPWARLTNADYEFARQLFANRESGEYGAYQPSRLGFGETYQPRYDERGLGFHITVTGYDNRSKGKYADQEFRDVGHVIDNDKDWQEVADMMAMIQRALTVKSVK